MVLPERKNVRPIVPVQSESEEVRPENSESPDVCDVASPMNVDIHDEESYGLERSAESNTS